jgi:F0F1-type ATP synthase membrane subunit b/b'
MKEITKKYMESAQMLETAKNAMNLVLDGLLKAAEGDLDEETKTQFEQLRAAMGAELEVCSEKVGLALEKIVDESVLQAAIDWYASPAAVRLREVQPVLQAYARSLDEEMGRRIEAKLKELSA